MINHTSSSTIRYDPMLKLSIIIFAALLSSSSLAQTSSSQQQLLIVRGNGHYPPYEMQNTTGKLSGIHIEMIRAVAQQLNIKTSFRSLPWKRAIHWMKQGKADAITYIGKTKAREEFAYFSPQNTLSTSHNGFFTLKTHAASIDYQGKLANLRPYRIGTIQGYSYGKIFDNAKFLDKDNGAKDQSSLMKKLASKRFELAIADIDTIRLVIKQQKLMQEVVLLRPLLPGTQQYIAFSRPRQHEQLAIKFADAMSDFKKSSAYTALLQKYGLYDN